MNPRFAAEAFEHGLHGDSVRAFPLLGLTPYAAHQRLLGAGFRCQRLPLAAYRTYAGEAQWWAATGGLTTVREKAASEYVYAHDDGGVVRLFLERGPTMGFEELSIKPMPFARRSLRADPRGRAFGWADEIGVVSEKGVVLPKALRVGDGLRFDPSAKLQSFELARAVFAEQFIPLRASLAEAIPNLPFATEGRGLAGVGLTLVPRRDFWATVRMIRLRALADPSIEIRKRGEDIVFFFAGDRAVRDTLIGSCSALASLTVRRGSHVVTLDPIGYESSASALVGFVHALLPLLSDVVFRDSVSGDDVTQALARFPSKVLETLDPSFAQSLLASAPA